VNAKVFELQTISLRDLILAIIPTSLLLHIASSKAFVEKSDAQSDVNTHTLFLNLARDPILNENVCRVRTQFISSIGNFGYYLHSILIRKQARIEYAYYLRIPLALRLA